MQLVNPAVSTVSERDAVLAPSPHAVSFSGMLVAEQGITVWTNQVLVGQSVDAYPSSSSSQWGCYRV